MATRPAVEIDEVKPDMTPMVDVVFLLIVFFLCIDFKMLEAKLPAFLPRDHGSAPTHLEPEEQLVVRVHVTSPGTRVPAAATDERGVDPMTGRPARFRLAGHRVAWEVGPKRFEDLAAATTELARIATDPQNRVVDRATGEQRPLACIVDGLRGTCYDDVARAADACRASGFTTIEFGAGRN
jgi:hypothetical protein